MRENGSPRGEAPTRELEHALGAEDAREPAPRARAGVIGRPHGLDGSFHVQAPNPGLLVLGGCVEVDRRAHEIVRRAGTDTQIIIRLAGIEDRTAASRLRGRALEVDVDTLPRLAAGEYWAHELEGCVVVDGAVTVGRVQSLISLPSCEALEVTGESNETLLLPMVSDAIRAIDVAARRIEVDLRFLGEHVRAGGEGRGDGGGQGRGGVGGEDRGDRRGRGHDSGGQARNAASGRESR